MDRNNNNIAISILDAIPSLVFVVDHDVTILAANKGAADFLSQQPEKITGKKGGTIFHCLNALEAGECGLGETCKNCVIRSSVINAFRGDQTLRAKAKLERGPGERALYFMVSTTPFMFENNKTALVVLEDITELVNLQNILPICSYCRKIRNDSGVWNQIEEYLEQTRDAQFSHGICPECADTHYPWLNKNKDG